MQFKNFDTADFLRDSWQKKPRFIRNPWESWESPLSPDELAGLACEAEVESRLITGGIDNYALEHGPFADDRFTTLGEKNWTLLVQAADHYVPEVAALIEPFRFIPDWRIDDVMVSYAADGGGVGPHFDQYDVFLIQGLGKRKWQIGKHCDEKSALIPDSELSLLAEFEVTEEWILEPGDMLYVPPGFAHNGIAVGDDCMTYSIGFRAPSRSDLIFYFCDQIIAELKEDDRYNDPDLEKQDNSGEITGDALKKLHAMVTEKLSDQKAFNNWFGEYSTESKYPDIDWRPQNPVCAEELQAALTQNPRVVRNSASRFAYIKNSDSVCQLFADGESYHCQGVAREFAQELCASHQISISQEMRQSDNVIHILVALINRGCISFAET